MDKQQEFVLRTLEERDIRFVRLWFTDVLGLPQVRGRGPRRAGAGLRRGHRLRRLGDRGLRPGLRVRHDRQAGPRHLPDPALARRGPRHRPDVLRHPDAGRLPVLRRPALRPQAHPGQDLRPGLHLLHPPRDRVLPAQGQAAWTARGPTPADSSGYFDHTPQNVGMDFRRQAITMLESMGISVEFSPPRGRPRPAGDRPALRRRALHRRQHHDVPAGHEAGGAGAGRAGDVHAEAVLRVPRLRHAHPPLPLRGRPQRLLRVRLRVPALQGRPLLHRGPAAARGARSPPSPTSGSTPTSASGAARSAPRAPAARPPRTSAGATTTAPR